MFGMAENVFSSQDLNLFEKLVKSGPLTNVGLKGRQEGYHSNGYVYSIDQKNKVAFDLMMKVLVKKIKKIVGDRENFQPYHAKYAISTRPLGIHTDTWGIDIPESGRTIPENAVYYKTFLIPYCVDGDVNQVEKAYTIEVRKGKNSNVEEDWKNYLSHVDKKELENYYIEKICKWKRGSLIWHHWNDWHTSGHFVNFSTKEAIVLFTYKTRT